MAFGDPMQLATLYDLDFASGLYSNYHSLLDNGPLEVWADTAAMADGWTYAFSSATPTFSRQAGTRTGGAGAYFQRMAYAAPGVAVLGDVEQYVRIRGDDSLDGIGHSGLDFTYSVWARNVGSGTCTIRLFADEYSDSGTIGGTGNTATALTGTWTEYTVTRTISTTHTLRQLHVYARLELTGAGSPTVELDEARLYSLYTFSVNPAMPDDPRLITPNRSFQRSPTNKLIQHRPGNSQTAKFEYTMHLGSVGLAQLKALRSLWLLQTPLRWNPNLAHLPTELYVLPTGDFNLRMRSPSVNSNNYFGTLQLAEI
jgi:hypothetical protein